MKNNLQVIVALKLGDTGTMQLSVRDNGIGLPKDFDLERTSSLGLKIVRDAVKPVPDSGKWHS